MNIITIAGLSCITYLLTAAQPIIWLKNKIGLNIDSENDFNYTISKFLSCCLCLGFWIGITFTMNIYEAAIIAVCSEIICRIFNKTV